MALVAAGDPGSSRLVYAMVAGLAVIGVALVVLGAWLVRQTRPDLEVLAPLERMGDADWKKRDPSTQRRMLDQVRPEGAEPLTPEPEPPPIDAEFDSEHPLASFSDLGPGLAADHRDPTPVHAEFDTDLDDQVDDEVDVEVDEAADVEVVVEVDDAVDDAVGSGDVVQVDAGEAQGDATPVENEVQHAADHVDDADDEALSDRRG